MKFPITIVPFLLCLCSFAFCLDCVVQVDKDLPAKSHPLYVKPGTGTFFLPTNEKHEFTLKPGDKIELFCDSGFKSPANIAGSTRNITCNAGKNFAFDGKPPLYTLKQIECRDWPKWETVSTTTPCMDNKGKLVEVRFPLGPNEFEKVYETCFDIASARAFYTHFIFNPSGGCSVDRPRYWDESLMPAKVSDCYSAPKQKAIFRRILNRDDLIDSTPNSDYSLNRGHMGACSDFPLVNLQRSTFTLINAPPQFHIINSGNWANVETKVRELAAKGNRQFEVYAGTHETIQFKDSSNNLNDIFLYDIVKLILPVPQIYFKVVIEGNSGVAILSTNNPYLGQAEAENSKICDDVFDQATFLAGINRSQPNLGYVYACTVKSFAEKVIGFPNLPNVATLLEK